MKQTLNLEQKALKFTELKALNEQELRETEGGKVPWWAFIVAPIPAYIISKFEDGCQCDVIPPL